MPLVASRPRPHCRKSTSRAPMAERPEARPSLRSRRQVKRARRSGPGIRTSSRPDSTRPLSWTSSAVCDATSRRPLRRRRRRKRRSAASSSRSSRKSRATTRSFAGLSGDWISSTRRSRPSRRRSRSPAPASTPDWARSSTSRAPGPSSRRSGANARSWNGSPGRPFIASGCSSARSRNRSRRRSRCRGPCLRCRRRCRWRSHRSCSCAAPIFAAPSETSRPRPPVSAWPEPISSPVLDQRKLRPPQRQRERSGIRLQPVLGDRARRAVADTLGRTHTRQHPGVDRATGTDAPYL